MNRRAAVRICLMLTLTGAITGCQDSAVGTIKADRKTVEGLQRAVSDRPQQPPKSKARRNQPDYNDRSSKFPGGEGQP
jgi:hypothetical protein